MRPLSPGGRSAPKQPIIDPLIKEAVDATTPQSKALVGSVNGHQHGHDRPQDADRRKTQERAPPPGRFNLHGQRLAGAFWWAAAGSVCGFARGRRAARPRLPDEPGRRHQHRDTCPDVRRFARRAENVVRLPKEDGLKLANGILACAPAGEPSIDPATLVFVRGWLETPPTRVGGHSSLRLSERPMADRLVRRNRLCPVTRCGVAVIGGEMTESDRVDEEALLVAVRAGDGSFGALYRHFERSVLGFFMRATGKPDLAGRAHGRDVRERARVDRQL